MRKPLIIIALLALICTAAQQPVSVQADATCMQGCIFQVEDPNDCWTYGEGYTECQKYDEVHACSWGMMGEHCGCLGSVGCDPRWNHFGMMDTP